MEYETINLFFDHIEGTLNSIISNYNQFSQESQEDALEQCQLILDIIVLLESVNIIHLHITDFIDCLRELICVLRDTSINNGRVGRSRLNVRHDQLQFLVENGFRINDIALMFGCSRRTIERRMRDSQLTRYTNISDDDLDNLVTEVVQLYPQCGEKTISGRLICQGVRVQRQRIRSSLHRVDPIGVTNRLRCALHRRAYSVRSPNSLWHIDGYHRLIRWKIVIHGAIDGFSRLITFLRVSNNNRAETVLFAFRSAIEYYGLPSRIRTDQGGENVLISEYMLTHPDRGPERNSVLVGRSVHNQRIERLWRDLYSGCVCFFYNFFYFLEDTGVLDIMDPLDIYALHFVMLPVIQTQLDLFKDGWANHPLRTEKNRTPQQLWTMGLLFSESNEVELSGLESSAEVYCSLCIIPIVFDYVYYTYMYV
jgi:transposase InsO family protein